MSIFRKLLHRHTWRKLKKQYSYREYSNADIQQLKQIVILRKLGIPVQQIADILDGALPLQDALEENIASLNAQIDALNGALAMTKQLRQENQFVLLHHSLSPRAVLRRLRRRVMGRRVVISSSKRLAASDAPS